MTHFCEKYGFAPFLLPQGNSYFYLKAAQLNFLSYFSVIGPDPAFVEVKDLLTQFYKSHEWQRIKTIPHQEGDYFELSDVYTNVTLDMKICGGVNVSINNSYQAMFSEMNATHTKKILLSGLPGFGKTMLVHKITSDWAHRKLPCFDIIFTIKLRYLNPNDTIVDGIMKQLWYPLNTKHKKNIFEHILISIQFKVLLIFDGIDEVPFNKFPHVLKILNCNNCNLLLTTRPHMVNQVKRYFHCFVELKGFNRHDIRSLVFKLVGEETNGTDLYEKMERKLYIDPDNDETYYCPFFVYISFLMLKSPVYDDIERNGDGEKIIKASEDPVAQFYFDLIRFIIKTNQVQKNMKENEVHQALYDAMMLSTDAMLRNNFAIYDIDKVKNQDIWKLGLLSGHNETIGLSVTTKVDFIHLSIQETLAAFHIIKRVVEQDTGPLQEFLQQWMTYEVPKSILIHNLAAPFTIGKYITFTTRNLFTELFQMVSWLF